MKTTTELNSKWWYRLVKVIFLGTIVIVLLIVNGTILSDYNYEKKKLKNTQSSQQVNGLTYEQLQSIGAKPIADETLLEKAQRLGIEPENSPTSEITSTLSEEPIKMTRAEYEAKYGTQPNVSIPTLQNSNSLFIKFLGNLLLGNILTLAVFEIFRRAFYYIVLGSLRPKKD